MQVQKLGTRGILFTFYELKSPTYDCVTSVYAIAANRYFFICDTYLGPYYMRAVRQYLETEFGEKQYIVFNSHYHWDHTWGNSDFKDSLIVSHKLCRKFVLEYGKKEIDENRGEFAKEEIELTPPNTVFSESMAFAEEGVEFFYSPGHTEDSASCYDAVDRILFVGDNIDDPIPSYIRYSDLNRYTQTLENYMNRDAEFIVSSHGGISDKGLINKNMAYVKKLISGDTAQYETGEFAKYHRTNMDFLKTKV